MSNFSFVPRATALAAATFALSLSTTSPAIAGTAPVSTGSNSSCGTGATAAGTYGSYQGTGQAGCTVGPLTFFDFSSFFSYTNGAADTPAFNNAPAVAIAPGANVTGPALKFTSASLFATDANTTKDYYFEYYIDPPIDILGFSVDDLPFVNAYVEASVCVGATFNQSLQGAGSVPNFSGGEGGAPSLSGGEGGSPQDSCSFNNPIQIQSARQSFAQAAAVSANPQYYYLINNGTADVTQNFTTMDQFADVILHVHIGPGGSIDDFGTGAVLATPEPGEWALTGLGGLAMAGALRRRRRRTTST